MPHDDDQEDPPPRSYEEELIQLCLGSFCDPGVFQFSLDSNHILPPVDESNVKSCGPAILGLLLTLCKGIKDQSLVHDLVIQRLDDLRSLAKEKFYAFPFKEVPACWRELYRYASLLKVSALAAKAWGQLKAPKVTVDSAFLQRTDGASIDEIVQTIDMALIMAGPPSNDKMESLNRAFDILQKIDNKSEKLFSSKTTPEEVETRHNKRQKRDRFSTLCTFVPPISKPVLKVPSLSLSKFEDHMLCPKDPELGPGPLIVESCLEHWPARNERPWSCPSYLMSRTIGGRRLVPIELGRSYVDDGWSQKIVSLKEFLEVYMSEDPKPSGSTIGYLAQHNLFSQIPSLRNDIAIPDFCYASCSPPHKSSPQAAEHAALPQLGEPLLNAWFGPAGTISPLHTDPYHNILAQVVGKKYVRLYAPRESEKLYARAIENGGVDMSNTSTLDVGLLEGWDGDAEDRDEARKMFPLFSKAEYVECILKEGDCLYIPLGWWHYVRSLSPSFSVSFWFNGSEEGLDLKSA
ncbi:hypothetical protein BGZ60DRAFT_391596 [Tricladium varicosporioides]|nr:hypothetical protein BGZ60DRAFT_391596 [Hymenoscyphus varicosporioides]